MEAPGDRRWSPGATGRRPLVGVGRDTALQERVRDSELEALDLARGLAAEDIPGLSAVEQIESGERHPGDGMTACSSATPTRCFPEVAYDVLAAGYSPLPLPQGRKEPPPPGWTGAEAPMASYADVTAWVEDPRHANANTAARLPKGVIGLDVDAYDGKSGDRTWEELARERGDPPPTYVVGSREGRVSGIRLYRLPEGVEESDLAGGLPGIDVIRHTHRYVVAPGSVHPLGRVYRCWHEGTGEVLTGLPNVAHLPVLPQANCQPFSREHKAHQNAAHRPASLTAGRPCQAVLTALTDALVDLVQGGSRHDSACVSVARLVRLGEQGHQGVDRAVAEFRVGVIDAYSIARIDEGGGSHRPLSMTQASRKFADLVTSAVALVERTPTSAQNRGCCAGLGDQYPKPTLSDALHGVPAQVDSSTKRRQPEALVTRMCNHIHERFELFKDQGGHAFAVRRAGGIVRLINTGFVLAECRSLGITAQYSSAAKDAAELLKVEAFVEGVTQSTSLRVHRPEPGTVVVDLGEAESARCVVVTRAGWEVLDSPPTGTLFRRSRVTKPLATPIRGRQLDEFASAFGWERGSREFKVLRGWWVAGFLPDIPRPMLAFVGPPGSAKTTRARMAISVLDPKGDSLGGTIGRNFGDDDVKALAHYLVAYDNLGRLSEEVSDFIARLVTGNASEKRELYSDGEIYSIEYRRTGVLTALSIPSVKSDAIERLLPIACAQIGDAERRTEAGILREWEACLPEVFAAVLDEVVLMLRNLPAVTANAERLPRMADYYLACSAVCPCLGEAFWDSADEVMAEIASGDPFIAAVLFMIEENSGDWEGNPSKMAKTLRELDPDGLRWLTTGRQFSNAVTRDTGPLRAAGIEWARTKRNGVRYLRLTRQGPAAGAGHPRDIEDSGNSRTQGRSGSECRCSDPANDPVVGAGQETTAHVQWRKGRS